MSRRHVLTTAFACLLLGLAASLATAAPAGAADIVGYPTNQRVDFKLTHDDTVQVFNDPSAISPMCWRLWNNLQLNRVFTPNVTYFSCMIDVTYCVDETVWLHNYAAEVVWTWSGNSPECFMS